MNRSAADAQIRPGFDRYEAFARELDALKARITAKIGEDDARYIRRLDAFSRVMEVVGRLLIHFSVEPVSFLVGVVSLWIHKQLQATEIGHMALHGVYDGLPGCERFKAASFRYDSPVEETSWRRGHNEMHHTYTNIAGKDPDIRFGLMRLTDNDRYWRLNRIQVPFAFFLVPNFSLLMNLHFSGVIDSLGWNGLPPDRLDFLPDRSRASARRAWRTSLRKLVPYYLKNYVFFPALAGTMFWKVLLGNWLAETMRDVYSALTIFCGHVSAGTRNFPADARARTRGEWYAMQVESTNDFEIGAPWSILCGGLERQIEHHLFPHLPCPRLREIAPEVRAICTRHGVEYRTGSWPAALGGALAHIRRLARDGGAAGVLRGAV
ncbi:MAG: fatty acid desaturase [Elusimicrobia bacterium]|nr:fatty acid desaturase [Elusimicrobiota bacterium]